MRKDLFITLIILLYLPFSISGRSQEEVTTDIIIFLPEGPRWVNHGDELKKQFSQSSYTLELFYSKNQNEQNTQLESILLQPELKVVVINSHNDRVNEITPKLIEQNIEIVVYDRLIKDSRDYHYFLTYDYKNIGKKLANSALQQLADRGTPYNMLLITSPSRNQKLIFDGIKEELVPYIESSRIHPVISLENYEILTINVTDDTVTEAGVDKLLNLSDNEPEFILSTYKRITRVVNEKLDLLIDSEQYLENVTLMATSLVHMCTKLIEEEVVEIQETRHYKTDTGLIMVDTYLVTP